MGAPDKGRKKNSTYLRKCEGLGKKLVQGCMDIFFDRQEAIMFLNKGHLDSPCHEIL